MTLVTLVTLTNKELLKRREVVGVTAAFRRSIVFGNLIQKKGHRVTRVTGSPGLLWGRLQACPAAAFSMFKISEMTWRQVLRCGLGRCRPEGHHRAGRNCRRARTTERYSSPYITLTQEA